ncbi:MAG: exopolysaccharide biosynthesis polyprenyl glycosylphosphotransferase [Desulfotomaculaceae bacterium]|nr:exopolysaccharide biosynthesis polyprenyl glycosylphosphotransferase [Desulfotomaculaceae bacterium]
MSISINNVGKTRVLIPKNPTTREVKGYQVGSLTRLLKRIFDLLMALILLCLILPLMLLIIVVIRFESPGSALFKHTRIGRDGKQFGCLKFRTMVNNAEIVLENLLAENPLLRNEWEQDFKLKDDPRVTRVGKFLRKTSLDELPQIFNVLMGDMSFVGPRPIVKNEIPKYGKVFQYYKAVSPGVTGLWQVNGRNNVDYEQRVKLDYWYITNWSIWLDFTILIRTLGVVMGRKGAY